MCIKVLWYFQIRIPDGCPRYNILINGCLIKDVVKLGINENNA